MTLVATVIILGISTFNSSLIFSRWIIDNNEDQLFDLFDQIRPFVDDAIIDVFEVKVSTPFNNGSSTSTSIFSLLSMISIERLTGSIILIPTSMMI